MKNVYNFSKSETLIYLNKVISDKHLSILDQISFSKREYLIDKKKILKKIKKKFKKQRVIIRSSGYREDKKVSLAGKYKSFLNINVNSKFLELNIEEMFLDLKDLKDNIFIQKYISNTDFAGVLFTRDVDNLSPYYVLNCDYSKKTNLVTSGSYNPTMEVHNIYKYSVKKYPKKFYNLLNIVKKIEKVFPNNLLDIEFAKKGNKIFIFQCRSLKTKLKITKNDNLDLEIQNVSKKIKKVFLRNPTLIGNSSLLSNMADWNPAEMIGAKSTIFSSTLYMTLITNEVWATQRSLYGYKDVRPNPLMINIGQYNYIDIRTDLNSFLPHNLDEKISKKLISFYLNKLKKNNYLHDKIEFKLIPTCYQSDLKNYFKNVLNKKEILIYEKKLSDLTSKIINPKFNTINKELDLIKKLQIESKKIYDSNLSEIQKIFLLINICQKYGTLPFAGLARCSFISKKIFNNLIEENIIKNIRSEKFFSSIKTVINEINIDLFKLKNKRIKKKFFLEKYGHLRPSTYSISNLSYREKINYYFDINKIQQNNIKNDFFKFTKNEIQKINIWLKKNKLEFNAKELIKFTKQSVYFREKAKFEFTKTIDQLFQIIIFFLNKYGIKRNDIEFLDLQVLLNAMTHLDHKELRLIVKDNINHNKKELNITNKISLPDLIVSDDDCYHHSIKSMRGNYITNKILIGQIYDLKKNLKKLDLKNKIVFIENADPGYDFIFNYNIKGLITMYGGPNSHMSIRCNELNIPAVIGIGKKEFYEIKKNTRIELNCLEKNIRIIN